MAHRKRIATLGRHLFRRLVPGWQDLSRLERFRTVLGWRLLWLPFAPKALDWELAILRDKERPKITFFCFKTREKQIAWLAPSDLRRNLEVDRLFRAHGVMTLPLSALDVEKGLAGQRLIPQAFSNHAGGLAPLDSQLLVYARESARRDIEGTHYHDAEVIAATYGLRDSWSQALATLDECCANWRNQVPLTWVHGDLTHWNILREMEGQAWLIDFDRAFRASAFYDFIYAWIADGGYDRGQAQRATIRLASALEFGGDLSPADVLRAAVALFVLDNIVYLGKPEGRISEYTLQLTIKASDHLDALKNQ